MNSQDKEEIVWKFFEKCLVIRRIWDEYYFIYETSETHRKLLDKVAKNFFEDLQEIFIEYILLNICKITDPARFGKHDNLTIKYILELMGEETAKKLGLDKISDRIHLFSSSLRPARNKIIVHPDKKISVSGKMLGTSSKEAVDSFWTDLQEFVNRVSEYFFKRPYPFDPTKTNMHNAECLLEALKKSIHYDSKDKHKIESSIKKI